MMWGNNSLNHSNRRSIYLSSQKDPLAIIALFESGCKDNVNVYLWVRGYSYVEFDAIYKSRSCVMLTLLFFTGKIHKNN